MTEVPEIKLPSSPIAPTDASSSPPSYTNSNREFAFNEGSKFALFLDEKGVHMYTTRSVFKVTLPFWIVAAILIPSYILLAFNVASIYEIIYADIVALVAGIVSFVLMIFTGKKVAKGSSRLEWEQESAAKKYSYEWSQVRYASLAPAVRKGRVVLSMLVGSGMKSRRRIVQVLDEARSDEIKVFLSEKIGDTLKMKK